MYYCANVGTYKSNGMNMHTGVQNYSFLGVGAQNLTVFHKLSILKAIRNACPLRS